jgi:hypothetical protein
MKAKVPSTGPFFTLEMTFYKFNIKNAQVWICHDRETYGQHASFFFFSLPRGRTVLLIILDQFFFCLSKKKKKKNEINSYSVLLFNGSIKSSPYTPYSV